MRSFVLFLLQIQQLRDENNKLIEENRGLRLQLLLLTEKHPDMVQAEAVSTKRIFKS